MISPTWIKCVDMLLFPDVSFIHEESKTYQITVYQRTPDIAIREVTS